MLDVVNLNVLDPVAQRGLESLPGFGIKNDPLILPILSVNRRLSLTTARAPEVWPINTSPTLTFP